MTTITYGGANLYPKQRDAIFDPARVLLCEASTKSGKAQPLDALIYTPTGPVAMSDVRVGTTVLTVSGSARVVAIHPQGEQDIYEVRFRDGSSAECTADHLWEIHSFVGSGFPKVVTTDELRTYSAKRLTQISVPTAGIAMFAAQAFPLHPYLVGVLIGDGGLTTETIMFTSADDEIVEAMEQAVDQRYYSVQHISGYSYRLRLKIPYQHVPDGDRLSQQLDRLGLLGRGSHEKHIPDCYRYNTPDVRWAVLQGIMDTDGWVDSRGQPVLEQTSAQLAEDVREVVESLGGYARLTTKRGAYTKADGTRVQCRVVYRLRIVHPFAENFFNLQRKYERCRIKKKQTRRYIESIVLVRRAEAQCIEIADSRGLYLTDHLIATHNSTGCLAWILEQAFDGQPGWNYWWVAPVFGQAEFIFRRCRRKLGPIRNHCRFNQSTMTVELPNETRISFKSGERPDDLYGEDVHAVVMDEASRMREEAWHAIRSTLTYTRGPVRIIGNVKGRKNWFYTLARDAEAGAEGMAYHRITAWDAVEAGVLAREEIEQSKRDFARLGREGVWRQLYMAEAADDGDNPFGLEAIRACVAPLSAKPPLVAGVDLAGRGAVNLNQGGEGLDRDYTAIVMLDREGVATYVDRFRAPHTETETRIVETVARTQALVDSTGTGDAIVERLQRRGDMRVEGYTFTERSRQDLLEHLALMVGEEAVHFPDGSLRAELESFEFVYSSRGVRFAVPAGAHDDLAMALALAAKKLPWRRKNTPVPIGVPSPAGSRWQDSSADVAAWRQQEASQDPATVGMAGDPSAVRGGPLLVLPGSGASKWGGADR